MSHPEVIRGYLRERYPVRRFVPLALLVSGAGILASPDFARMTLEGAAGSWLRAMLIAYLVILAFRVWDDLEDSEHDAHFHPERITVRVKSATPFLILQLTAAALASLLVLTGPQPGMRLLALLLLGVMLGIWYRTRAALDASPVAGALILLAKYPVIAYVAAPALWSALGVAHALPFLLTLYVVLCIHEALDDPILRRSFGRGSLS